MPLLATRASASARGFGFGGGSQDYLDGTGGSITQDGSYQVHTFTSGGVFEVTVNGKLIFSKKQLGYFPDDPSIVGPDGGWQNLIKLIREM